MAEETKQIFLDLAVHKINPKVQKDDEDPDHWVATMEDGDNIVTSSGQSSSIGEDSTNSSASCSSSCSTDLLEDASSSSSSSSSSILVSSHASDGPLYELSELMVQLPIKRGLSKFYTGKSQSYTSLASVKTIEDLAKKVNPYNIINRSKMKSCKSYAGISLDAHKSFSPKATISKKTSSRSSFFSSTLGKRGSLLADF